MKTIYLLLLLAFYTFVAHAQQPDTTRQQQLHTGEKRVTLGVGVGLPYGWAGLNIEMPVYRGLAVAAGVGLIPFKDPYGTRTMIQPAYNLGLNYALRGQDRLWQPKLLAMYGINGFTTAVTPGSSNNMVHHKAYRGVTVGVGNEFMFGEKRRNGFSVDLLYIASSGFYAENEDEGSRFKLGIAFKHRFLYKY